MPHPPAGAAQNMLPQGTEPPNQEHPPGTGMREGSRDNNECIATRSGSQEGTCDPKEYPFSEKDEACPVEVSIEEKKQK